MQYFQPDALLNAHGHQGAYTVPGTISACPISTSVLTTSPANHLGSTATSAPTANASSALLPMVFWFGRPEVKQNPILMERLIRNMGEHVLARHDADPNGK
jgi:polyribonucleotide 5'-hydroxyl-kinase